MRKKLSIIVSMALLTVVIFMAVPKVYIHKLFGHHHLSLPSHDKERMLDLQENKNTQDCDLEKFETPVYFTIFKFILNCNPFKTAGKVSDNYKEKQPSSKKTIYSALRAPPRG